MEKQLFEKEETYLPITMQQFEDLANEMLVKVNALCAPQFLDAENMARIAITVIHGMGREQGIIKKSDFFERCVNRLSCQLTFGINEGMNAKAKMEEAKKKKESGEVHLAAVPEEVEH